MYIEQTGFRTEGSMQCANGSGQTAVCCSLNYGLGLVKVFPGGSCHCHVFVSFRVAGMRIMSSLMPEIASQFVHSNKLTIGMLEFRLSEVGLIQIHN